MKSKDQIQQEATTAIIKNNYHGIVLAAMRSGKTKMTIDALRSFQGKVLWITDKQRLRDIDIPEEFKKWNADISNIDIICYNSCHKINKVYDLVILDECQKLTENNIPYVKHIPRVLACTGTLPNKTNKKKLYDSLNLRIIYELSVDDAVKNKVIAPYKIQIINHKLESRRNTIEIKYTDDKGIKKSFFTTEFARYSFLSRRIDISVKSGKSTKHDALARMRLIGKSIIKERLALNIMSRYPDKKILIFCSDIAQAERISPLSYHSKTDDKCFKALIEGDINHLTVVSMVDTGTTFPHLDIILLLSSNSSNVQTIQRIGRSLMYKDNFTARIIVLCAEDTIETQWLRRAINELNPENVEKLNIEDFE